MVTKETAVFRALADPTRRRILDLLRRDELTVGALAARFRTSRPAVSRHLRKLRAVGLVRCERRGTERLCRLNPEPLRALDAWLGDYRQFWRSRLHEWKAFSEKPT
ncbi:MAG: ArsR/SmtB family transcription factor [Terriglobales bacterium]